MKNRELKNLGIPRDALRVAGIAVKEARDSGRSRNQIRDALRSSVRSPEAFLEDPIYGELAQFLGRVKAARALFVPRNEPAPYERWGDDIEASSVQQMENACALPVSLRGALMPDAHLGYGLPIGGVLATDNAVIPYAVGVDIACRVKMTVFDMPVKDLEGKKDRLARVLESETRFGIGSHFRQRRHHAVLDEDWGCTEVTRQQKDKAWSQLGSSGSGNHFVEYGVLEIDDPGLGLEKGIYLALLSHSGSRGVGATVAGHYSRLAIAAHPELPKKLRHLSWLDLDSEAGQEYWHAMELMGKYAAANHDLIHRHIARTLGADVLLDLENHHNFAWKEEHDGRTVVVHRKGATPAGLGVIGIIPGSMATATYVCRGKGSVASLNSSSHGAGRRMSRKQAKSTLTWSEAKKLLAERSVTLLSAGLDEVPMVYKNIDEVMRAQSDLVEPLAKFWPRIVKMAPSGEPPED